MRGSRLIVMGGLFLFATAAHAADCRTKWNAQLGENAIGTMWAESGEKCVGDIYTGSGIIRSLKILSPARYGTASTRGLSTFSYTSKSGFVGRDSFTIALSGQAPDGTVGTTIVAFMVEVSR